MSSLRATLPTYLLSSQQQQILGDYVLHESLGEGGMGEVYRATHRLSGQRVALKRIRTALLQPGDAGAETAPRTLTALETPATSVASGTSSGESSLHSRTLLAHEFQTLASLHHPHIVNVLDYGFDLQQNPFFTMELLESPMTILQAAARVEVRSKVDLLVQLLHALAYLHQRQIIHRDIKPSNVLVVNDQVKLVDFGIAGAMGGGQQLAGTLQYMAPELFLGQAPTPASDLYSLGVVAFEMLTHRFPYEVSSRTRFLANLFGEDSDRTLAPSFAELLSSWQSTTDGEGRCTEDIYDLETQFAELEGAKVLSAIIGKLMLRHPGERYQDALQVIQDLGAALGQELATETSATRESFLQAAEFVGRERELKTLEGALDAAQNGRGSLWMIAGESGVGKSRLTRELGIRALVSSARVVRSQATTERGTNYALWGPVVRALCLDAALSDADIGVLRDIAPDIETLLERRVRPPPALSPQAAQARLHRSVVTLLQLQLRPVLILVEDLQWAGAESLELLAYLSPLIGGLPLLILGNYREDEATEALRSVPATGLLRLGRLDDLQIRSLCESMMGPVSAELVAYLKRHTEGNVLFLVEMVRALAEMAGQLREVGNQELPEQLLTGGMERIVQRRLEQVASGQRGLLELAAVAGRRLDTRVLGQITQSVDLAQFLCDCANAAVLEEERGTWQFAHDKIREWLLHHLDADRSRALHREVAEAITALYPSDPAQHAVLAYHWDRADVPERASDYSLKAGAAAARLHAVVEARAHYANALATLARLPSTTANLRRRVDAALLVVSLSLWTATAPEILRHLDDAEALLKKVEQEGAATPEDRLKLAQVAFWRGRALFVHGDYSGALSGYEQARELARAGGAEELCAVSCGLIGQIWVLRGHMGRPLADFEESLRYLGKRDGTPDWARVAGFKGLSLIARGQVEAGMKLVQQAKSVAKDPTFITTVQCYVCIGYMFLQDWPAVLTEGLKTAEAAAQVNDQRFRCVGLWVAGWGACWVGDLETSERYRAEAREILRRYRGIIGCDWWMNADVDAALLSGRPQEAIELAKKTIAVARSVEGLCGEALAHRGWARALAALDGGTAWDAVQAHLDESFRLLRAGEAELELAHTHAVAGDLASRRGDDTEAQAHFIQAAERYEAAGLTAKLAECRERIASGPSKPPAAGSARTLG